jgi:uncharacterized membrane protein YhdT
MSITIIFLLLLLQPLTVIMMRRKTIFILSKSNDSVTDSAATTINGFRKPSMQEMSCLLILWLFSVVVVGVLQSMMPMCHEGICFPPRSRFAATTKMVPLTLRLNYKQKNNHVWRRILLLTVIMMRRKMIFVLSKSDDGVTDSAATTINGFRKPSMQEMSCLLILWLFSVVVVGVLQSMMPMCHEGICFPSRSRFAATTKMVPLMLRLNYKQKTIMFGGVFCCCMRTTLYSGIKRSHSLSDCLR